MIITYSHTDNHALINLIAELDQLCNGDIKLIKEYDECPLVMALLRDFPKFGTAK